MIASTQEIENGGRWIITLTPSQPRILVSDPMMRSLAHPIFTTADIHEQLQFSNLQIPDP